MRVLIIDDDSYIREMICSMLKGENYEVFTAADGKEGMRIINDKPGIDIVITDLVMPEKEGLETIREIKEGFPYIKILAISGGGKISAENYLNIAKSMGAVITLKKPFVKRELLEVLGDIII